MADWYLHTPQDILKQYWGFDNFRPAQEEIIQSIVSGRDTLVLLPTGGGKSICYQVPAMMLEGICLVISPLIALMQDQVQRLQNIGIDAACVHAGMRYTQVKGIFENAQQRAYKLLYLSPERLQTDLFNEYLPGMQVSMVAVDEAHCISQWGHDFRPDYLQIAALRRLCRDVPFLALTATATPSVEKDIIQQLQLKQPNTFITSYERPNIYYKVQYTENKHTEVVNILKQSQAPAIVYCRSRKQTETITKHLLLQNIPAVTYHAGMDKAKRREAQNVWMAGEVKTIVATTAFGMGIDKGDVRNVIHYDAPEHLEAYYQEAGRAGRDGKESMAILLFNATDINRLVESTAILYPEESYLRHIYQCVSEYLQIPISAEPYTYYPFNLKEFCRNFKLEALPASYALKLLEQEGLWTISETVFSPPTIHIPVSRHELDDIMQRYPKFAYAITSLLRLYGTLFLYPTPIRLYAIAKQLRMKQEDAEQMLLQLNSMGVIEYNAPPEGEHIFVHHYRVDSKHLVINTQRMQQLKQRHIQRTEVMLQYLQENKTCRTRFLLQYFGETKQNDCGHCDVCTTKIKALPKGNVIVPIIIETLKQTKIGMPIQELTNKIPQYDKQHITAMVRQLVDERVVLLLPDGTVKLA